MEKRVSNNATTLEIAKLRKNPFTLVAETNTSVWADYKTVQKALLDVIVSCRSDQVGLSEFVILHGEIGTGKSHALRYLKNFILESILKNFDLHAYIFESTKLAKKTDFLAIYRRVMEGLRNHVYETANALDAAFEEKAKASGLTRSQDIEAEKIKLWKNNAELLAPQFPSLIYLLHGTFSGDHAFSILCGAPSKQVEAFRLNRAN